MCTVSFIGDQWTERYPQRYPDFYPVPTIIPPGASKEEVDALRNEVAELKKLLGAAKEFDDATGQPDCETEEKVGLLRRLGRLLGIDLDDVLVKR